MPRLRKWIDKKKGVEYTLVSETDTTLTQRDIPGDAKAIGDRFKEIDEKIDSLDLSGSEKEVINADTHFDFPSIGSVDFIYKAYKEKKVYQWNAEMLKYEQLDDFDEIKIINGGSAEWQQTN